MDAKQFLCAVILVCLLVFNFAQASADAAADIFKKQLAAEKNRSVKISSIQHYFEIYYVASHNFGDDRKIICFLLSD